VPLRRGKVHCDPDRGLRLGAALHLLHLPDARRGRSHVDSRRLSHHARRGQLATYRFNTNIAEHHFCSRCGIYTHHKRRSNPNQLGVNVACLEGISPFDFRDVLVYDGSRHPADDAQHRTYIAGTLTFTARD
jgi:hypothetical protein